MTENAHCPFCSKPMSVWSVMKAGIPSWIRCPHCRQRVRLTNLTTFLYIYLSAVFLVAAALNVAEQQKIAPLVFLMVLALVPLAVIEFGISVAVCRRGKFERPKKATRATQ